MGMWWIVACRALETAGPAGTTLTPAPSTPVAPGNPGEPRLLGSDRGRVPRRARGLVWRGAEVVLVERDALVVVSPDGTVRREPLWEQAPTSLAAHGDLVVVGTQMAGVVRMPHHDVFPGDDSSVVAVDIAPDGTSVVAVSLSDIETGSVVLWATEGSQLGAWGIDRCRPRDVAHLGATVLVGCGEDVVVIEPRSGPVARVHVGGERISSAVNGKVAVTAGDYGYGVWKAGAREPARKEWVQGLGAIAVTPSGEVVNDVYATDLLVSAAGVRVARTGTRVSWSNAPADPGYAHDTSVRSVAWSDDGRYALSSSLDGDVAWWDVAKGERTAGWTADRPVSVAIYGERAVLAGGDRVWIPDGGDAWTVPVNMLTGLSAHGGALYAHADNLRFRLDPGGEVVAVTPADKPNGTHSAFPDTVTVASWSEAGFVTGHDDGTVRVWPVAP